MKIIRTELPNYSDFSMFLGQNTCVLDIAATGRYWRTSQIETITVILPAAAAADTAVADTADADATKTAAEDNTEAATADAATASTTAIDVAHAATTAVEAADTVTTSAATSATDTASAAASASRGSAVPVEITLGLQQESDEYDMLVSLSDLLKNVEEIITFNGSAFDLPHIRHKLAAYGMTDPLVGKQFRDLFLEYRPLAGVLALPSRRLIDYAAYFAAPPAASSTALPSGSTAADIAADVNPSTATDTNVNIAANASTGTAADTDARRTLRILAFDALFSLLDGHFTLLDASSDAASPTFADSDTAADRIAADHTAVRVSTTAAAGSAALTAADTENTIPSTLYYTLSLERAFPARLSLHDEIYHLIVEGSTARLSVHLRGGRIRCYHTDTENYDYLPLEGYAIHKSMSAYVDKTRKEKAVRTNCFHLVSYSISFLNDRSLIEPYLKTALQYLRNR